MAKWSKIGRMGRVDDRRGMSGGALFASGGGLIVVLLTLGLNYLGLQVPQSTIEQVLAEFNQLESSSNQQTQPAEFRGEDEYELFVQRVLGSTDETWTDIFVQNDQTYKTPELVLFRQATASDCGVATSAVGPHYCPTNQTMYLDETFFDELRTRYGADAGDVAQAYVIAHEVGHHVQNQLGALDAAGRDQTAAIAIELQADCYAGVWAHDQEANGVITKQEMTQAQSAASAVGDDNIQEKTQGRVNPENWTHGSSEQRVNALMRGFESGDPAQCTQIQ